MLGVFALHLLCNIQPIYKLILPTSHCGVNYTVKQAYLEKEYTLLRVLSIMEIRVAFIIGVKESTSELGKYTLFSNYIVLKDC